MRHTRRRLLAAAGMAAMGLAATACVAPPLTYPLLLAGSQDATAEIQALLGSPPPVETDSAQLVATVAQALAAPNPGCELLPAAQVIWRAPASPTTAAIELRSPCDDSVAGAWYELTITGDDQAGFTVALASKRNICKRGVSGILCV